MPASIAGQSSRLGRLNSARRAPAIGLLSCAHNSRLATRNSPLATHNGLSKIRDGAAVWHRMGDVGYLDDEGRFWYCGRKSQRVETRNGSLFSANIEEVFNTLPGVRRTALVGVGSDGKKDPVIVIELAADKDRVRTSCTSDLRGLVSNWYQVEPKLHSLWYAPQGYIPLRALLFHPSLPVDVRHNSKINREQLADWAIRKMRLEPNAVISPPAIER